MHSKFARVIIDRAIRRELDYAVPELLSERVSVGARVRVPFRDRRALATVVALLEQTNAKGVREIEALIGEGPTLSEPPASTAAPASRGPVRSRCTSRAS